MLYHTVAEEVGHTIYKVLVEKYFHFFFLATTNTSVVIPSKIIDKIYGQILIILKNFLVHI